MADYYPLLAKALANLPSRTAPTARRAIYERARKALIGQLRSIQPPMPESDIASEDAALDRAIERLEAEYGAQPTPPPVAPSAAASPKTPAAAPSPSSAARQNPPAPPPSSTPGPRPPAAAPTLGASPKPPPAPSPRPASASASAPPGAATPPLPRSPVPPAAARRPVLGAAPPAASASSAPSVEPVQPLSSAAPSPSIAPPVAAPLASSADDGGLAPPVAPSPPSVPAPPASFKGGADVARPIAPGRAEAPRRSPWPLVAIAIAVGVAGAIALAAFLWRETPQDFAIKATSEAPDKATPAGQNKIAERIKAGDQSDAAPAASETPIPTVSVPVAPVSAAPGAPAPGAASPSSDNVAQTQVASQAQATPVAAIPAASRAAILIAPADEPQKPAVNLGSAVWSIIPAASGQPSTLAVRVEIDIPDQKMHATMTMRKNADPSLPATHTIDLRTSFADGAEIKGIKDMGLPQLRNAETATGEAISGVRVKINDSYYLVGLTRSDADSARNLDLLATHNWFDFPLLLNDDRIAKLTFEKGAAGESIMLQALSAWN